jgi:hypothetical protein
MSSDLGQSVWFGSTTSVFPEVVALLCKEQATAMLTLADGSDRAATLYEIENGDLWYRPAIASDCGSTEHFEGVPIEQVLAIRVS